MAWFTKQAKSTPTVGELVILQTDRIIESKDEAILFLRTELQASREHIGWLQQQLSEERDRANLAADELIVAAGRGAISSAWPRRERAAKPSVHPPIEPNPLDSLPYGHRDGTFASAEEAAFDDVGEI